MLLGSPYGGVRQIEGSQVFDETFELRWDRSRYEGVCRCGVALLYALCNANAQAGLILGTNQLGSKQTIAPNGASNKPKRVQRPLFRPRCFQYMACGKRLPEQDERYKFRLFPESLLLNKAHELRTFGTTFLMFPKPQEPVLKKNLFF